MNGSRYQYYTSTKSIIIISMRDENISPDFEKGQREITLMSSTATLILWHKFYRLQKVLKISAVHL